MGHCFTRQNLGRLSRYRNPGKFSYRRMGGLFIYYSYPVPVLEHVTVTLPVPTPWHHKDVVFCAGDTVIYESGLLAVQTYFPAVTNISSRHLEKTTLVALPTLRPAAGLPQMASLLAMLQTTTLPNKKGKKHQQGTSDFQS